MQLEQIKEYAELRKLGESTSLSRMNLLKSHATALKDKISEDKRHLAEINEKIEYYKKIVSGEKSLT